MSRTIPADDVSLSSSSDFEVDSDYEEEGYNGRYYPQKGNVSQPQKQHQWSQRRSSDVTGANGTRKKAMHSVRSEYSSDTYSDMSSSRHQHYHQKESRRDDHGEETDEEESGSGGSLEFTSGLQRPGKTGSPVDLPFHSEKVLSYKRFTGVFKTFSYRMCFSGFQVRRVSTKNVNDAKVPSAPPMNEPVHQIKEEMEKDQWRPRAAQFSTSSVALSSTDVKYARYHSIIVWTLLYNLSVSSSCLQEEWC